MGRDRWNSPELAIPTTVFPDDIAAQGFLTPTPMLISPETVRVYGGMRDTAGVSRIGWVDVDTNSRKITRISNGPAIGLGSAGDFDDHGMILGDVIPDPIAGGILMVYVGFQMSPKVKFRAFTGVARSVDGGDTFQRESRRPLLSDEIIGRDTDIVAAHWIEGTPAGWSALVAIGDGWESIGNRPFPRYNVSSARGPSLYSMVVSEQPLLTLPKETYRLGRPRMLSLDEDRAVLVATGGKRNGDYRPYAFECFGSTATARSWDVPVVPGCAEMAAKQAAYPAQVFTSREEWVFFNGDEMGQAGALLIRRNRSTPRNPKQ